MVRIQIVIDEREREAFRAAARQHGLSLSEWMRQAARDRLEKSRPRKLETPDDLRDFFSELATFHGDQVEDDWEAHKARIARSMTPDVPA